MMQFTDREFIPMLFGGDINTYSVARAFYEEYQVKTYVFGKYPSGPSYGSNIIEYEANEQNEEDDFFVAKVKLFAKEHSNKKILLIGCGDSYVALASKHKDQFPSNVIVPYIDFELMNNLQQKEYFYALCEKYGLGYPKTFEHRPGQSMDFTLEYPYPVILKPANSVTYWQHPFQGQDKVFIMEDETILKSTMKKIYDAGYPDTLIIQDMIPGNDEYMHVLTCYSDQHGKVKMMCLGHVLLEEHTPHGLGNHACIITEYNEDLMNQAKHLLEDLQYVGYSNFDIKYDRRDNTYKFFEINTRQGRSNYYVTGSGFNVAKYLVEDYVYGNELTLEVATEPHLWLVIPKKVAMRYVKEKENLDQLEQLFREGKWVNPIFMDGDLKPKRRFAMMKNYYSHFVKFKKYYS